MQIKRIIYNKFKGINYLAISPDGSNVTIEGQNGTGKTTIYEGFAWLMSTDRNSAVTPITGDNTMVEATFDNEMTLSREYYPNGSVKNKFYINGSSVPECDYRQMLKDVTKIDVKVFTKLGYFCEMSINDRRDILMAISKVKNADVVKNMTGADEILSRIEENGIDNYKTSLKEHIKMLKSKLAAVPAEIKGIMSTFKDLDELDRDKLSKDLLELNKRLEEVNEKILQIQNDTETCSYKEHLKTVNVIERKIDECKLQIKQSDIRRQQLIEEFKKVSKSSAGKCPTCGQMIPVEQFNLKRTAKLNEINKEGQAVTDDRNAYFAKLKEHEMELQRLQSEYPQDSNDNYSAGNVEGKLANAYEEKLQLERNIAETKHQLELLKEQDKKSIQIEELQKMERQYAGRISSLLDKLSLVNEFVRTKCKLIEEEINSKFQYVVFKLFDFYSTTGEVKDCCEVLLDGKPYSTALSKGERIKASMDCIKTLQGYFKVELPIFIDDSESITSNSKIDLPNQIFTLKAVEGKELSIKIN